MVGKIYGLSALHVGVAGQVNLLFIDLFHSGK